MVKPLIFWYGWSAHKKVYISLLSLYFIFFFDLNGCTSASHKCHANAGCVNTHGSYNWACKPVYTGDGRNCKGEIFKGYCMLLTKVRWKKYLFLTRGFGFGLCSFLSNFGENFFLSNAANFDISSLILLQKFGVPSILI